MNHDGAEPGGGGHLGFLGDLLEDVVVHRRSGVREDTDTPCDIFRRRGGSAANAAMAAASVLGPARVRFFGQVGADGLGDTLLGELVVVKDGPRPTRLFGGGFDGDALTPPRLEGISDTTGAGDAFAGGLLAARLVGSAWTEAIVAGHTTAAVHLLSLAAANPESDLDATAHLRAPEAGS